MPTRLLRPLASSALLLLAFPVLPAGLHAQLPKIFVASFGNDANDGSRGSPKRNFQAAHDAVAAGGRIVVLDTAGYGTLFISKSVEVTAPPGIVGFITATNGNRAISIYANETDTVSLRGLIIESDGFGEGIAIVHLGTLNLDACAVRRFQYGIHVIATTNALSLRLHGGSLRQCNAGVDLRPAGGTITAVFTDCQIEANNNGVVCGATNGACDMTLVNCDVAGNNTAINCQEGALVRVDNCRITGSLTGIASSPGSQVLARGNNTLENNKSGNTFPGAYSPK